MPLVENRRQHVQERSISPSDYGDVRGREPRKSTNPNIVDKDGGGGGTKGASATAGVVVSNNLTQPASTETNAAAAAAATGHASGAAVASPTSWNVQRGRSRVRRPSVNHLDNPFSEENLKKRGYHSLYSSFGKVFHVEKRWKLIREMGSGAYGVVISAADSLSGEAVAIKLVTRVFDKIQLAKRALREITLLRHFANHENITGLIDVDAISPGFNEIYIFMEVFSFLPLVVRSADLHQIIKSGQNLTNEHVQYFTYQILRGMKYVHSAGVIHRDLKPGNLLVNADCELKICDFGLSRGFETQSNQAQTHLTEYVATRWYRAPEIMLAYRRYNTAIDVWSIGCILAELLLGKPLFKGKDYADQLNKILDVLGTPEDKVMKRIGSEKAQGYVRSLPFKKSVLFRKIVPMADTSALDMLTKMLSFDPSQRITVKDALDHPWLAAYHDETDEPDCPTKFDRWRQIETLHTLDQFRDALWNEIEDYRREVRGIEMTVQEEEEGGVLPSEPPGLAAPEEPVPNSESPLPPTPLVSEPEQIAPAEVTVVASQPEAITPVPKPEGGQQLEEKVPLPPPPATAAGGEAIKRSDSLALPTPQVHHRRVMSTPADPVVTYSRRSSILQPHRHGHNTVNSPRVPHQSIPSYAVVDSPRSVLEGGSSKDKEKDTVAFPSTSQQGYIVPARSRTGSIAATTGSGGYGMGDSGTISRRLLRTLSTVSIHESGEGLAGGLADLAPIGKYIVVKPTTAADAPPSEIPPDFEMQPGHQGGGNPSSSSSSASSKTKPLMTTVDRAAS